MPNRSCPGVLAAFALLVAVGCRADRPGFTAPDAPYVATPEMVGLEMLRLVGVGSTDVVYDLGSGDGRLVIAAARDFGARAVGVEINATLVHTSREDALRAGLAERARFLWQDIFATDIHEATVVTLYLGEDVNVRLRPKLLRELRPGARVVSHDFTMRDWRPDRTQPVRSAGRVHTLYAWVVPADAAGRWQGTLERNGRRRTATLEVTQRFQRVDGALEVDGIRQHLQGELTGDQVALAGSGLTLAARITGDSAAGRLIGPEGVESWAARRQAP
ncbi:MAG: SAM-dependent methyltransferase [Candidatus Rokuibacteriota bacterium]